MKKKALSLALALVLCLGLLPTAAFAAETDLPDWYFLFAIFKNVDADGIDKNGEKQHIKYTMPQEEIDFAREIATDFETYMNEVGVMRAHVDIMEIDTTIKNLKDSEYGAWLSQNEAEPLLNDKVDLDQYDHVFGVIYLNDFSVGYVGMTSLAFQNGTGYSCIDHKYRDLTPVGMSFPSSAYVHEFLHFVCTLCDKWGITYDLHKAGDTYNTDKIDKWKGYYTDIILNRATGGYGTGVAPFIWQYPPRVLRTMTELTLPSGVTSIGDRAYWGHTALTKVTIPTSVTSVGYAAFWDSGVKDVYYAGTEAQWKAIQIGEYNEKLTNAAIHYNSPAPSTPQPTTPSYQVSDWAKDRVALAVSTGLAASSLGSDYRVNITRAQFAATAVKLYEAMSGKTIAPVSENPFTDTADPVILQAASMGFVSGVGNGKFSPDALVTREQAAVMLSSVYTKLGGTLPAVTATTFADDGQVAAWSRNAVAFLSDKGIVSGVGENRFSPQGQASIEQALLIALKMFEDLK